MKECIQRLAKEVLGVFRGEVGIKRSLVVERGGEGEI